MDIISQFESKVTENHDAELLGRMTVSDDINITLFFLNLVDHKVICAVYTEIEDREEEFNIAACVRFSICSNQDVYDEEVGKSLAVGRVIRAETFDFSSLVDKEKFGPNKLRDIVDNLVESRVKSLEYTLQNREETLKYMQSREQEVYRQLGQQLQEFK